MQNKPLTDPQREYIKCRLAGLSPEESYQNAFPGSAKWKNRSRQEAAYRLEAKPNVKLVLQLGRKQKLERAIEEGIIDGLDIMRELAAIAFADTTDYARVVGEKDKEGKERAAVEVFATEGLTYTQRKAISSIEDTKDGIKVKTHNKLQALKLLGDAVGLFDPLGGSRDVEDLAPLADLLNDDEDSDD